MSKKETANVLVRLPLPVHDWIQEQAERSLSSRSSEIVRTILQRMAAEQSSKKAAQS